MIDIEGKTIDQVFREAVDVWPEADFLVAPRTEQAPMRTLRYQDAASLVDVYANVLARAGYGVGHRVAVLVGTCPEHYVLKLALSRLGVSMVPINPDYRSSELAYVLEDSASCLAITGAAHVPLMRDALDQADSAAKLVRFDDMQTSLPRAPALSAQPLTSESEASLLYTSGTTGKPKGCILSHEYELMCGANYAAIGGPISLQAAQDRVLNPLPSFHVNAGVMNFFGIMVGGNALIQPERFSNRTWWRDIRETDATVFHYLGVVIAVLMADNGIVDLGRVRAGLGAGVEPSLHEAFESRFGIPLVEAWGMTEMCRITTMAEEPRLTDTRALGSARPGLEIRVADEEGSSVAPGVAGEMLIRHSPETPRKGFFSGYLNKEIATEEAWRDGWFHTGDTVTMDKAGMVFFVDRSKNIIRRSGENIAAAEVENALLEDQRITNAACIAVPDAVREEEVMACIVLTEGIVADEATARQLFDTASEKLAYYKPPGWILFVEDLPVTGTQKVVKHKLFPSEQDPREVPGVVDLRALKKRS